MTAKTLHKCFDAFNKTKEKLGMVLDGAIERDEAYALFLVLKGKIPTKKMVIVEQDNTRAAARKVGADEQQ